MADKSWGFMRWAQRPTQAWIGSGLARGWVREWEKGEREMGWGFLLVAVVLEVAWASTMKWTDGYTRPGPTAVNFLLSAANLVVLAQAMKVLPTALAYSVWTGLGAVGVALVAFWFQGEPFGLAKAACVGMIALGVIGLKGLSPA